MAHLKFYALTTLGYLLALAAFGFFASVGIVALGLLVVVGLVLGLVACAASFTETMRQHQAN